jgi:hypothetical protein
MSRHFHYGFGISAKLCGKEHGEILLKTPVLDEDGLCIGERRFIEYHNMPPLRRFVFVFTF